MYALRITQPDACCLKPEAAVCEAKHFKRCYKLIYCPYKGGDRRLRSLRLYDVWKGALGRGLITLTGVALYSPET